LIVGSLIGGDTPNAIREGALLWVPGTIVICVGLLALGAVLGRAIRPAQAAMPDWAGIFAGVAAFATFVLLGAGGLVTGFDEGLAVVDWPNTEGYNMFLYPLARMTGGVYLEHAHRLLGSLVGLTVLVLAIHIQLTDTRGRIKALGWTTLAFVIFQGVLGGLRVTGVFTLSTDAADTDPNIILAIIHGVFGQIVFAFLVGLAVFRSRAWATAPGRKVAPGVSTDRLFGITLLVLLIVQLVMGALVRHFTWALSYLRYGLEIDAAKLQAQGTWALQIHITLAVVVALAALGVGVRAWGLHRLATPLIAWLGKLLMVLIGVQLALGVAALIVTGNDSLTRRPTAMDVSITTLHQVVGAALLAGTVALILWHYRLLRLPAPQSS
jgi:cytochrome c oxidase assembly protein subunit 15